jgi:nickel transport protein
VLRQFGVVESALVFLMVWAMGLNTACGHTLYVFAAGEGNTIKGQVYLPGGTGVPDADIRLTTADGKVVATTKSDAEGRFTLKAPFRSDFNVVAMTADGHQARWNISADELAELPSPSDSSTGKPEGNAANVPEDSHLPTPGSSGSRSQHETPTTHTAAPLADLKSEMSGLKAQVVKLREEWQEFRSATQLRDVLGGVGYILGITGIAFYLLARKRDRS